MPNFWCPKQLTNNGTEIHPRVGIKIGGTTLSAVLVDTEFETKLSAEWAAALFDEAIAESEKHDVYAAIYDMVSEPLASDAPKNVEHPLVMDTVLITDQPKTEFGEAMILGRRYVARDFKAEDRTFAVELIAKDDTKCQEY